MNTYQKTVVLLASAIFIHTYECAAAEVTKDAATKSNIITIDMNLLDITSIINNLAEMDGRPKPADANQVADQNKPPDRIPYNLEAVAIIAQGRDIAVLRVAYQDEQAQEQKVSKTYDEFVEKDPKKLLPKSGPCGNLPPDKTSECVKKVHEIQTTKFPVTLYTIPVSSLNIGANHFPGTVLSFIDPLIVY